MNIYDNFVPLQKRRGSRTEKKKEEPPPEREEPPPEQEEPPPDYVKAQSFSYPSQFKYCLIFAILLPASTTPFNLCPAQIIRYITNIALPKMETRFLLTGVVMLVIVFFIRSLFIHIRTCLVSRMGKVPSDAQPCYKEA